MLFLRGELELTICRKFDYNSLESGMNVIDVMLIMSQ